MLLEQQRKKDMKSGPVVMGGASYEKLALLGSFINIVDLESVEALAKYIYNLLERIRYS